MINLNQQQQSVLLQVARNAISHFIREGKRLQFSAADPALNQRAGVFVTLRRLDPDGNKLRGCIGRVQTEEPLLSLVPAMGIKAATEDPRFPPIKAAEIPHLRIEISILAPASPLNDPQAIEIGRDGLMIEGYGQQGLLLPEVPVTYQWDIEQYLAGICRKANLPEDAWRSQQVKISIFSTTTIREEKKTAKGNLPQFPDAVSPDSPA